MCLCYNNQSKFSSMREVWLTSLFRKLFPISNVDCGLVRKIVGCFRSLHLPNVVMYLLFGTFTWGRVIIPRWQFPFREGLSLHMSDARLGFICLFSIHSLTSKFISALHWHPMHTLPPFCSSTDSLTLGNFDSSNGSQRPSCKPMRLWICFPLFSGI